MDLTSAMSLIEGGFYPSEGEDLRGARAVFKSDDGWSLYLERFSDSLGDVVLVPPSDVGSWTAHGEVGYGCTTQDLVVSSAEFAGRVGCGTLQIFGGPQELHLSVVIVFAAAS